MGNEPSKLDDLVVASLVLLDVLSEDDLKERRSRTRNKTRDREHAVDSIDGWSGDEMFRRQFRIVRSTFDELQKKTDCSFEFRKGPSRWQLVALDPSSLVN